MKERLKKNMSHYSRLLNGQPIEAEKPEEEAKAKEPKKAEPKKKGK